MVSKKEEILEVLNRLNGTVLTINSDVDQDTHEKVTITQENTIHKRSAFSH